MFLPKSNSEVMDFLNNIETVLTYFDFLLCISFDQNTKLGISVAFHASIIDIRWSTNEAFVINNHEFGVQINDLSQRFPIDDSMGP